MVFLDNIFAINQSFYVFELLGPSHFVMSRLYSIQSPQLYFSPNRLMKCIDICPFVRLQTHDSGGLGEPKYERLVEIAAYGKRNSSRCIFAYNTEVTQLEVLELLRAWPADAEGNTWT